MVRCRNKGETWELEEGRDTNNLKRGRINGERRGEGIKPLNGGGGDSDREAERFLSQLLSGLPIQGNRRSDDLRGNRRPSPRRGFQSYSRIEREVERNSRRGVNVGKEDSE